MSLRSEARFVCAITVLPILLLYLNVVNDLRELPAVCRPHRHSVLAASAIVKLVPLCRFSH